MKGPDYDGETGTNGGGGGATTGDWNQCASQPWEINNNADFDCTAHDGDIDGSGFSCAWYADAWYT